MCIKITKVKTEIKSNKSQIRIKLTSKTLIQNVNTNYDRIAVQSTGIISELHYWKIIFIVTVLYQKMKIKSSDAFIWNPISATQERNHALVDQNFDTKS